MPRGRYAVINQGNSCARLLLKPNLLTMDDATLRHFPRAQVQHGWHVKLVWLNLDYRTEEIEGITFFEDLIPCFLVWALFNGHYQSLQKLFHLFLLDLALRHGARLFCMFCLLLSFYFSLPRAFLSYTGCPNLASTWVNM